MDTPRAADGAADSTSVVPAHASTFSSGVTPLWASFLFTFSVSAGSLIVQTGITFLTTNTYKFGTVENYSLSLVQGLLYIVGAMSAGPLLRSARRNLPRLSSRAVLRTLMLLIAAVFTIPYLVGRTSAAGETPAHWPIWLLACVYSPVTGMLWPIVESYIAGGRSGSNLRSTIGWWNVVWSSSLVLSAVWMSRYTKQGAGDLILILSGVHVACAVLVGLFAKEPQPHPPEHAHIVSDNSKKLLITFRWLLPMSYLVASAMMPFLPGLLRRLEVPIEWHTMLAGTWLLARTIGFTGMQQTKAWHGRWWHPSGALILMLSGFALVALCQLIGGIEAARVVLVVGLAIFGLGMAAIYSGAIYYAMEVGQSEVDAGGAHEGLIGAGYTIGPAIGLAAAVAVSGGHLAPDHLEPTVLVVVAVIAAILTAFIARRIHKVGADARKAS